MQGRGPRPSRVEFGVRETTSMNKQKPLSILPRVSSGHWKPLLYGLLALAGGIVLLWLSQYVKHKSPTTRPAETTATAPAEEPAPAGSNDRPRRSRADAAASSLSSLILLFSMACFVMFIVCMGWLVVEIRNARPAWKRQTKFPRMRE